MRYILLVAVFILYFPLLHAQELFVRNEPASNIPKGAIGIRVFDQTYKEVDLYRNLIGLKLMYGLTPKLSLYLSGSVSNHHDRNLPQDFTTHIHTATENIVQSNTPQKGVDYPYLFNGFDLYAKYRFLSNDGQNSHFRMAAYAEASWLFIPSHEAEPELMDLTSGVAAGIITTYLKRHFAASLTTGFIIPKDYTGNSFDKYGGIFPTTIQYGKSLQYNFSFGYLLSPQHYKSYDQTNWNLYLEFTGKAYEAAVVNQVDGTVNYTIPNTTPLLKAGNYLDINPGIQCIVKSNLRIDCSLAFHLINQSYTHQYPLYMVGVQRYFYSNKKEKS